MFWLVVDGLPLWLVERFADRERVLPTLTRLLRERRLVGLLPVSPNCQTPPSLFTLFSGVPPSAHGLTGYDLPGLLHAAEPLALLPAFTSYPREFRLAWDRYALAGQKVRLCQIPFVDSGRLGTALLHASNGFGPAAIAPCVVPLPAGRVELPESGLVITIEARGGCALRVGTQAPVIVPGGSWVPLPLGHGQATLAGVFDINAEPHLVLLGAWRVRQAGTGAFDDFAATPFIAGGISGLFRDSRLGRIGLDGGNGEAETLLASALSALAKRFWAEAMDAQRRADADLVIAYQPAYDLLFHELLGLIEPELAHYRPALAVHVEGLLLAALAEIDAALATLQAANPDGHRLVVCSDHGMKPIDSVIQPNLVLQAAGLLESTPDGKIDPDRSAAFFHPAETGLVCLDKAALAARGTTPVAVMDHLAAELDQGRGCDWFEFTGPTAPAGRWLACHYLRAGRGRSAKAHLQGAAIRPSRKTADHCTAGPDPALVGVVADLSARPLRLPDAFAADALLPALLEAT